MAVEVQTENTGRGVLEAGFQVLQAISAAPEGCGLSQLARSTGLAKATAYRLAEQLVVLGAVQRVEQRYFVGARMAELGRQWQAAPMLRRAAQRPGRTLAALTKATVAVCVLDGDEVHLIAGFKGAEVFIAADAETDLTFRTAMAQVLLAARTDKAPPPPTYSAGEWRRIGTAIADDGMIAVDRYDLVSGICCAAAAIKPNGTGNAAAVGCMSLASRFPPNLPSLVAHAAREIEKNLR
ncbi:IclR family transcriptional regulator [Nocardia sp. GCM10030253]|uniref:IclR family transcriptional regulator n=1 Tax=Nocardia sp. GCM10030253 TaxID=3273404 RepID=UPI0036350482